MNKSLEAAMQIRRALMLYVDNAPLSDKQALSVAGLHEEWNSNGRAYKAGQRFIYEGQLYSVVQNVTSAPHQKPGGVGMLAIYRPIMPEHEGTKSDPIPFIYGMDIFLGKVYSYEGKLYTPDRNVPACVYPPGSAGVYFWAEVV